MESSVSPATGGGASPSRGQADEPAPPEQNRLLAGALITYLLVVAGIAALAIVRNFPGSGPDGSFSFPTARGNGIVFWPFGFSTSAEAGLMLMAFFAGVVGSFLHGAQSLTSYVGNGTFKRSWAPWYLLRPAIGGILGFVLYFALRAGFISPGGSALDAINPHGVVALGMLGGWFSKTTTDKLQEVFETLFRTDADKARKDKLQGGRAGEVEGLHPSPVPPDATEVLVLGRGFDRNAVVLIDGEKAPSTWISGGGLRIQLDRLPARPKSGATVLVQVQNPDGEPSKGQKLTFS